MAQVHYFIDICDKEAVRHFIQREFRFPFPERELDAGILESDNVGYYSPDCLGISIGVSYETLDTGSRGYIFNIFDGNEMANFSSSKNSSNCGITDFTGSSCPVPIEGGDYINVNGHGTDACPLPEEILEEVMTLLARIKEE